MSTTRDTRPGSAQQWMDEGTACVARGDLDRAVECYRRAVMLEPAHAGAAKALGAALMQQGCLDDALAVYRDACERISDDADLWHARGWALEQMGKPADAVTSYREALRLNRGADGSFNNLGNCLQTLGRFDEAHEAYRSAIQLAPQCGLYYRNLVQTHRLKPDDPCFSALERLATEGHGQPVPNQIEANFAFGQALADIGQNDRSFTHQMMANALARQRTAYDEAITLGLFAQLPGFFPARTLRAKHGLGDASDAPVFVIGMPRSGSTLIEQILASHPAVFGLGECPDFGKALSAAIVQGDANDAGKLSLEGLDASSAAQWSALGADYLRRIAEQPGADGSSRRIVDKYLFNFMNVGFIHLALPNARFIHSRRSPLDTCLSIFSRPLRDVPFGQDLGELGRYYRAYDALMAHWRRVLPEGVMLEVQYEDLVDDLEGNVRRMLAHCGLDWDARCLAFHRTEREVHTASALQVRTPIYRSSLARWRPDAALLRPLIDGLGPALAS